MSSSEIAPTDDRSLSGSYEVTSDSERMAYTPEEVAVLLGLHVNSIYSMLKSGALPGLKAGHKWLISKRRFEAWLEGGSR
jgi:excisionase family DNA binding protein